MHVIVKIINNFFHLNIIKCSKQTLSLDAAGFQSSLQTFV